MSERERLQQSNVSPKNVSITAVSNNRNDTQILLNGNNKTHAGSGGGGGGANYTYNETTTGMTEHIEAPCCRDIHGKEPPDGGMRAWLVMISAFICNGVIFGIINTYGVIHALLTDRLSGQGDTEASSKAALVGSLTIGTTFLLSPVAGCLTDKIGLRRTTFLGGVLSAGGLLLSSYFTENISALYLTYGIMFGFGAALAYTPTLAILGHYFKRYLGKVSGFVTAGSSVFTVILPPALDYLLKGHGLETTLRVMAFISCFIIVCSYVYKPLHPPPAPPMKKAGRSKANMLFRSVINVDIWKRKRYVIWALCVPLALFGYFVPYVHMMKFIQTVFPGKDENLPVMCIGITSGMGRLIFGAIADMPGVNRIYLQQLSLICIGVVTLLLPLTSSYILLIVFTLVMGLFDGCFISLLGPIAYQICGPSGATQAIGFLLGLSSLPLTVGPPIAGKIFDSTGSYTLPFILAGLPPIVGASIMCIIRCVPNEKEVSASVIDRTRIKPQTSADLEKNDVVPGNEIEPHIPLMNGHTNLNHTAVADTTNNEAHVDLSKRACCLAETGIEKQYPTTMRIFTALNKFQFFTACAYDHSSSPLAKRNSVDSNTALLNKNCMSNSILDDDINVNRSSINGVEYDEQVITFSTAEHNESPKKRRYNYSTY